MPSVFPDNDSFSTDHMVTKDEKKLLEDFVRYSDPLHYATMALQYDISLSSVFPALLALWSQLRQLQTAKDSSPFLRDQATALDGELKDIFEPLNESYILATYVDIRYKDMIFTDIITEAHCDKLLRKKISTALTAIMRREEGIEAKRAAEKAGDMNANEKVSAIESIESEDGFDEDEEMKPKEPVKKKAKLSDSLIDYGAMFIDEMERKREEKRAEKEKQKDKQKEEANNKFTITDRVNVIVNEACSNWLNEEAISSKVDPDGLQFWKDVGIKKHPVIWEFAARGYLGAPGGNSSSERIFNVTDMIMDKKRNQMKEKARNALVILHENAHLFPQL